MSRVFGIRFRGLGLRAFGPGSGLRNQGLGFQLGDWGLQIVLEKMNGYVDMTDVVVGNVDPD